LDNSLILDGELDSKEPPTWSCDASRVAPLVVAFEEEVNAKNEIIQVIIKIKIKLLKF
jgi:hypothetical protein